MNSEGIKKYIYICLVNNDLLFHFKKMMPM